MKCFICKDGGEPFAYIWLAVWGKLLLKVMHNNIVLLHKNVTNCVT